MDPEELFFGATAIGSFAYGAGLVESEQRERRRTSDFQDELDRRQKRIDELETELDDYRDYDGFGLYDDDDDGGLWEDNDDEDGDNDGDKYQECHFASDPRFKEVPVLSIFHIRKQKVWVEALSAKCPEVTCKRIDGKNSNDYDEVGVYADGRLGGFLPSCAYDGLKTQFSNGVATPEDHYIKPKNDAD